MIKSGSKNKRYIYYRIILKTLSYIKVYKKNFLVEKSDFCYYIYKTNFTFSTCNFPIILNIIVSGKEIKHLMLSGKYILPY